MGGMSIVDFQGYNQHTCSWIDVSRVVLVDRWFSELSLDQAYLRPACETVSCGYYRIRKSTVDIIRMQDMSLTSAIK